MASAVSAGPVEGILPRPTPPTLRLRARRDRTPIVDLHVLLRRIQRVACGMEFLGRLEHGLRAEGGPGVVSDKQGLGFTDDLLGVRLPGSGSP